MAATFLPGIGYIVEKDIVDERRLIPVLTTDQIAAVNARIAAGSNDYPAGTKLIRGEDGVELTLQGVGAAAAFQPGAAAGTPTFPTEVIAAIQAQIDYLATKVLPDGGAVGQALVVTTSGYGWGNIIATDGVQTDAQAAALLAQIGAVSSAMRLRTLTLGAE